MTLKICPRCNETYSVGFGVTDFVHECNSGNAVLDNEDVFVTGDWEDYTGSANVSDGSVPFQGNANKLWGTNAELEGGKSHTLTRRGNIAATHRTRQHLQFNEFEGGEC
jgi:hypothetical protein